METLIPITVAVVDLPDDIPYSALIIVGVFEDDGELDDIGADVDTTEGTFALPLL